MEDDTISLLREKCRVLSIDPTPVSLVVSIREQTLVLFKNDQPDRFFRISTSSNPPSCRVDSLGTPWGLHRVASRFGDHAPLGTVFKGRQSIGKTWRELSAEENRSNLITTRILRLSGLEPGLNNGPGIDSFDRFIYIHGTNHEDRIGTPSSGGCIQLSDPDMRALYDATPLDSLVLILDPAAA